MANTYTTLNISTQTENQFSPSVKTGRPAVIDPLTAAEAILNRFGARAISLLVTPRQSVEGQVITARLSANDCYVCLEEACKKVARVAVRKYEQSYARDYKSFEDSLTKIFPDPAAYLARAIKSVMADEGRLNRREVPTVSLDTPISRGIGGDGALHLGDTFKDETSWKLPEVALEEKDDKTAFRLALSHGLAKISPNYLEALKRDMAREAQRNAGHKVAPESDRDRQAVCRARTALSEVIRKECGDDNPFVRLLVQQRSGRVRRKVQPTSNWNGERQEALFRRLLETNWADRSGVSAEGVVGEAIVNDVSLSSHVAPPSPEMRQAMRVLDLYTVDYPSPRSTATQELWEAGRVARQAGKLEEALRLFKSCYEAEPTFIPALNNVGNLYSQLGNLRDALKVFLSIIELQVPGEHNYIAATNAADIYLTWFDAGRNKERNIEQAIHFAKLAMRKPTPMRACNLLQAYAKDRYFEDARRVMQSVLRENSVECPAEKFLNTLFQIRDSDLVALWNWLDSEMERE